jgi:tRNA(fMet)-specific endonuclease VapC
MVPVGEAVAVAIVSVEEQMRGWLAAIAKERKAERQVSAYAALMGLFEYFRKYTIVPFDDRAAREFEGLRYAKVRLATMDLKIAATALANGALLLSANRSDFNRVPGLRVENWLD